MDDTQKPSFNFKWWYKGKDPLENTLSFNGKIIAKDADEALRNVEKMMRAKYPTVKWMQGKEIEGVGHNLRVTFGPTVQKLKTPVKA